MAKNMMDAQGEAELRKFAVEQAARLSMLTDEVVPIAQEIFDFVSDRTLTTYSVRDLEQRA